MHSCDITYSELFRCCMGWISSTDYVKPGLVFSFFKVPGPEIILKTSLQTYSLMLPPKF